MTKSKKNPKTSHNRNHHQSCNMPV